MEELTIGTSNEVCCEVGLKIMRAIMDCKSYKSLRMIDLSNMDFSEEENVYQLLELVAKAPSLEELHLQSQHSDRETRIKLKFVDNEIRAIRIEPENAPD